MLALFAAANRGGDVDAAGMGILMTILIGVLVLIAIGIAIAVFYCLSLSKALKEVAPENRDMEPGQVWLVLIPFFNWYWNFKIAADVPSSLKREFRERGMGKRGDDYGANVGKWYAICSILNLVPFVNYIAVLAALILLIMFWVKIAGYGKELREDDGGGYDDEPRSKKGSRDDDYEDDYEDEPRPKKKRRTDDYND